MIPKQVVGIADSFILRCGYAEKPWPFLQLIIAGDDY